MQALKVLFSTDVGLMSLAVIVFMLGMGAYYTYYFIHRMHEDETRERRQQRQA